MARRSIAVAALLALCASHASFAQSPAPQTSSSAPSPLHFTISTDKLSYHVGEAIQVKMDFTADVEHVFRIVPESTDTEDDSLDTLSLSPVELASPYDANTVQLVRREANSHNHIPPVALGPTGARYALLLNDRYVLKKPGVLRLAIVSRRVSADFGGTGANAEGEGISAPPFPVTSNTLTITIEPATPEWQATELAAIERQLDAIPRQTDGTPSPERRQAIERLVYLNSPGAARELVRRFATAPDVEADDYAIGLALSDYRSVAIEAANKLADDPSFGITYEFEMLMTLLPVMDKFNEMGEADVTGIVASGDPQFLAALNAKQGKAFETTLETLESMKSAGASPAETAAVQQAVPKLIGMFRDLPPDVQDIWLGANWSDVKDAGWVPVLKSIATEPLASGTTGQSYGSSVKTEALEDWAQLDPEGARQTILNAMFSDDPQFGLNGLYALPDKTLPDAQQRQLAGLFLAASDPMSQMRYAAMLERYGGATAWDRVSSAVPQSIRNYTCATQVILLNFAARVSPDTATGLFDTAMVPPDNSGEECRAAIFSSSMLEEKTNIREKYAIAALSDPNRSVVGSAVLYLQQHGTAKAEEALWRCYELWALAAAAKTPVATGQFDAHDFEDFQLGLAISHAIEQGPGWLADREKLERLNMLAGNLLGVPIVPTQMLAPWMHSPVVVSCEAVSDTESQFTVAQYTTNSVDGLKARLALFPSGTTLAWDGRACTSEATYSAMFNDIASAASLKGVTLRSMDSLPAGTVPTPATNDGNDDGEPAPTRDAGGPPSPDADNIVPDRIVVVN